jgi:hypothetical protein
MATIIPVTDLRAASRREALERLVRAAATSPRTWPRASFWMRAAGRCATSGFR